MSLDFANAVSLRAVKGSEMRRLRVNEFTPMRLGQRLRTAATEAEDLRPFLVLDVPRTEGLPETLRQAGLRNLFATRLLELEDVSGVLATGLGGPDQQRALADTIIDGIARRLPVGALHRAIRDRHVHDDGAEAARSEHSALAYLGTALFTTSASLPAW